MGVGSGGWGRHPRPGADVLTFEAGGTSSGWAAVSGAQRPRSWTSRGAALCGDEKGETVSQDMRGSIDGGDPEGHVPLLSVLLHPFLAVPHPGRSLWPHLSGWLLCSSPFIVLEILCDLEPDSKLP